MNLTPHILIGVMAAFPAFAQSVGSNDQEFVSKAVMGNMLEIEQGRLAAQSASNQGVRNFGALMVKDHSQALEKLKAAASELIDQGAGPKNDRAQEGSPRALMDPPAVGADDGGYIARLNAEEQRKLDELRRKSGPDFDRAYIAGQISAHQETAMLLKSYLDSGANSKLKAWARESLPTVKTHLAHLLEMRKNIGAL